MVSAFANRGSQLCQSREVAMLTRTEDDEVWHSPEGQSQRQRTFSIALMGLPSDDSVSSYGRMHSTLRRLINTPGESPSLLVQNPLPSAGLECSSLTEMIDRHRENLEAPRMISILSLLTPEEAAAYLQMINSSEIRPSAPGALDAALPDIGEAWLDD